MRNCVYCYKLFSSLEKLHILYLKTKWIFTSTVVELTTVELKIKGSGPAHAWHIETTAEKIRFLSMWLKLSYLKSWDIFSVAPSIINDDLSVLSRYSQWQNKLMHYISILWQHAWCNLFCKGCKLHAYNYKKGLFPE